MDDNDVVEMINSFSGLKLTQHPTLDPQAQMADPDFAVVNIPGGAGSVTYPHTPSVQGWYMMQLLYHITTGDRAIRFRVKDATGHAVPIYWVDGPPETVVDITLDVEVDSPGHYAYYKGGAYRDTRPAEFSYVTDIAIDGNLLYKRAFSQGKFSFPLGFLSAGAHTLTARWESSGGFPTKLWESVCEHSFDPSDAKKSWDPVQMLYMGNLHTRDYDAWSGGVAFTQRRGAADDRPAPVRRGGTFSVALEHASLGGGDGDVKVLPVGGLEVTWPSYKSKVEDYAGGYFTPGGFETRQREHWTVTVPPDAPVGRYVLRGYDAGGQQISWPSNPGGDILFYVIYDPYRLVDGTTFTKADLETWAYDEDEDGKQWERYGLDSDHDRDDYAAFHIAFDYQKRYDLHAIRRDETLSANTSILDLGIAAVDQTTDEFESLLRLYRLTNQRIQWQHWNPVLDAEQVLIHEPGGLSPSDAATYGQIGTVLPNEKLIGQCQDFSGTLTALARSIGIPARPASAQQGASLPQDGLFGWNYHVFTEAYLPASLLPKQGGTRSASDITVSDADQWLLFDSNDHNAGSGCDGWGHSEESIDPRVDYFRSSAESCTSLAGTPGPGTPAAARPADIKVSALDWDPNVVEDVGPLQQAVGKTQSVLDGYNPANSTEFWITSSSLQAYLGWGDKDLFKVEVGSATIAVEVVRLEGELVPTLCAVQVDGALPPTMPQSVCDDPGTEIGSTLTIGPGPGVWQILVFSRAPADAAHHGDWASYEVRVN